MKSAAEIIDLLEHVRNRKPMYFHSIDVNSAECFVTGFIVACHAGDVPLTWAEWNVAAEHHGWKGTSTQGPAELMRQSGYSDDEIVDELFAILVDAVRLAIPD